jgi:hypothetical protein
MAKTKILHIQGNEIMIGFPVKEVNAVLHDGSSSTVDNIDALSELWVVLSRGILVRQYKVRPAHDFVFFTDKGHLPCGVYDIEVYYDTEDGQHMRLKYPQILTIVDSTEAGQMYESDDFDVDAYYPIINSRASAVVISNGIVSLFAGRGLNADLGDDSVNLRAGYGDSQVDVTNTNVNINIKD